MPKTFREGWDRLDPDDLREAQGSLLHRFLRDCVLPFSAHYQRVFEELDLDADDFHSIDDLRKLPFTTKLDLQPTPDHPKRALDFLLVPDRKVLLRRVGVILRGAVLGRKKVEDHYERMYRPIFMTSTTGRSAEPTTFLYTAHDLDLLKRAGRRINAISGVHKDDRLLNTFPYAPHLAFWQTHYSAESSGVFSVSSGGGKVMGTDGNVRMLSKVRPTVLTGMPTFVYHVMTKALAEGVKVDSLRRIILGGEKVPDGARQRFRELARELGSGDVGVLVTFGFTEAKMAWIEAPAPADSPPSGYLLYPDLGIFEVVDPDTGDPVPEGEPGEIVYTPLNSRGTVVLRYRTGDLTDGGVVHEPCPYTGRKVPRLTGRIFRRSNVVEMRMDKIKGTLVDFNELEYALDDAPWIHTWQLEIRKRNDDPMELDELVLHAVRADSDQDEHDVVRKLNDRFAAFTETRLNQVHFHSDEEMREMQGVGEELKEKKIVDRRPRDGKPAPPRRATTEDEE